MFSALLHLQLLQTGNRLLARVRRLRQPKYLLGALVGGLYLYFNFFRYVLFDRSIRGRRLGSATATAGQLGIGAGVLLSSVETFGALFLLALSLLAWLLPKRRAALVFSEAEIAFLFPAPISRRALIHFRLMRLQLGILFSIVILTLVTGRFRAAGFEGTAQHIVGWWILLSTLSLHSLALSFARSLLLERGISNWRRRTVTLCVAGALLGAAFFWASRTLPTLDLFSLPQTTAGNDATAFRDFLLGRLQALDLVLSTPPLSWVLWPFRVPLRPFLAADAHAFLLALGPALALLALHYVWIVRADVAFEEASIEVSRRHAERIASVRAGSGRRVQVARRRRDPFPLRPTGVRLTAILWKNLFAVGPLFNLRTLIALLTLGATALALVFSGALPAALTARGTLAPIVGAIVLEFSVMIFLFGSQMLRNDFRQDLGNVELLKTYPLPGWQIALGQLLAPTLLLTVLQWLLLIVTLILFRGSLDHAHRTFGFTLQLPWLLAAAAIAPPFNFLSLTIPNAAVLLLPAWFQTGPSAPQGVEVMGQRLIFFFGQFFVLAVTLLPAAGTGLAVYFAIRFLGGSVAVASVAAPLATALILVGESALALVPLGRWFERLDVSAENNPR